MCRPFSVGDKSDRFPNPGLTPWVKMSRPFKVCNNVQEKGRTNPIINTPFKMAHCMGHKNRHRCRPRLRAIFGAFQKRRYYSPLTFISPTRQKNAGPNGPAYGVNAVYNIGVRAEVRPVAWRGCRCPWSVHPCDV